MSSTPQPLWSSDPEPTLLASRERASGELVFPPIPDASPIAVRHEVVQISRDGVVYSYSVIHPSPKSGQAPYALGFVDLPGPVRIFGRLEGDHRPAIGEGCRAKPDATYGYVFELAGQGAQT